MGKMKQFFNLLISYVIACFPASWIRDPVSSFSLIPQIGRVAWELVRDADYCTQVHVWGAQVWIISPGKPRDHIYLQVSDLPKGLLSLIYSMQTALRRGGEEGHCLQTWPAHDYQSAWEPATTALGWILRLVLIFLSSGTWYLHRVPTGLLHIKAYHRVWHTVNTQGKCITSKVLIIINNRITAGPHCQCMLASS